MKKFKFTMASLLTVKQTIEKQLKGEMAEAEARIRLFESQKREVETRLERAKEKYLETLQSGSTPRTLRRSQIGFNALFEKIAACEEKLRVAWAERGRIQKALIEVMTERKMLERLREKQWDVYLEELKKEEAANIDDFLSSRLASEKHH